MNDYDCIVIGGGPAGSTVAALVAERGYRTLLVEREKVPRYHVGESLLPEANRTLARLGVLDRLEASHFPIKRAVRLSSHDGARVQTFSFAARGDATTSYSWQVVRSEFDELLWRQAAAKGAACSDLIRVVDVHFEGQQAVGVTLERSGGTLQRLSARVIVDASGQHGIIANRLGLRQASVGPQRAAVWGYYENARRDSGNAAGDLLIARVRTADAWFWYLPLPGNRVNIGVVGSSDSLLVGRGKLESVFEEQLVHCPAVLERLVEARLASEFRVLKHFNFASREPAGDGWVLVGDALAELDPLFSAGLFAALRSGELAADAIVAALHAGDSSAARLGGWAADYLRGIGHLQRLTDTLHDPAFCPDRFLTAHPEHHGALTDLLAGRLWEPGLAAVLDALAAWVEAQRAASVRPQRQLERRD
jgi:flavin-dependent dehydrogenase